MSSIQISEEHIGDAILHLIKQKSARDGTVFSKRALAEAIGVNISMISRTTNEDLSKRSIPNIPLLIKIVQFFKDDGFNITIDDLLNFQPNKLYFNHQSGESLTQGVTVNLYEMLSSSSSYSSININVANRKNDLFAVKSDFSIPPVFKKGTVFVVDKKEVLKEGKLAIVMTDIGMDLFKVIKSNHVECQMKMLRNDKVEYIDRERIKGVVIQANVAV